MFHLKIEDIFAFSLFVISVLILTTVNYYFNLSKLSKKSKYIFTGICLAVLFLIPVPFYMQNRYFGALPLGNDDFRAYVPMILIYCIVLVLKYYSIQMEIIKGKRKTPSLGFTFLFLSMLPYYMYNYDADMPRDKEHKNRSKHIIKLIFLLLQFFGGWFIMAMIFYFIHLPHDMIAYCFRGHWGLPIIMSTGVATIIIFNMVASVMSLFPAYYNIVGGYDFKYYQDKAFLSTSLSEFWRRWNLWGNEWFFTYLYKPLRRKFKLQHSETNLIIFVISALIHTYFVGLYDWEYAWMIFLVFFLNGVVIMLEEPAIKTFPIIPKTPKWLKFLLTLLFLDLTLGLFGLCFSIPPR